MFAFPCLVTQASVNWKCPLTPDVLISTQAITSSASESLSVAMEPSLFAPRPMASFLCCESIEKKSCSFNSFWSEWSSMGLPCSGSYGTISVNGPEQWTPQFFPCLTSAMRHHKLACVWFGLTKMLEKTCLNLWYFQNQFCFWICTLVRTSQGRTHHFW